MARTGFPVNVLVNRSSSAVPDGNTTDQRPESRARSFAHPTGGSSIGEWINPAAFAVPGEWYIRRCAAGCARGPGAWQIDMGTGKHIPLNERVRLEFRAEFFNIFNHPQYGLPQATFAASGFGSITTAINTSTVNSSSHSGGDGNPARDSVRVAACFLIGQECAVSSMQLWR